MPVDYSTWLTKQQAAKALNCATKTVEQLAKASKLQTAKYKRPEGGPALCVYHPDDVERLRKERNPEAEAFVLPAEEKPATSLQTRVWPLIKITDGEKAVLFEYFKSIYKPAQPAVFLREKVFLTLPEAVQLTGLPDATIRRLIKHWNERKPDAAQLNAMMTGDGWRVRRKDLEAL